MSHHGLTDREYNALRDLLSAQSESCRGWPWMGHRKVIIGTLWIF